MLETPQVSIQDGLIPGVVNYPPFSDRMEFSTRSSNLQYAVVQLVQMGQHDIDDTAIGRKADKTLFTEQLWCNYLTDSSYWSDNRFSKRCINEEGLPAGKAMTCLSLKNGLQPDTFVGNRLIHMFGLCGRLLEANLVFSKLLYPNVFSWSAIISANAKLGQETQAIELYHQMQMSSVKPDGHVFVAALKACAHTAAINQGKLIHGHIIASGYESDLFVCSTLIDMYAKSGSLEDACRVFASLTKRNVVAWNAIIACNAQHGRGQESLQFFQQMQLEGIEPDEVTFVCVLKACSSMEALNTGNVIHALIVENGFESDIVVGSTLINMYAKCGALQYACIVFNRLPKRNAVTWNTMIAGYAQHGNSKEAFHFFQQMQQEGLEPNQVTFVCVLEACSSMVNPQQGNVIHGHIVKCGLEMDAFVTSSLIDMYAKSGSLGDAHRVFENRSSNQDVVIWSAVIECHAHKGHGLDALCLFQQMQQKGMKPNKVTFLSILKACSSMAALNEGRMVHVQIVESGFESDGCVVSALIDMYAKCGSLKDGRTLLDKSPKRDVVAWTAIIAGYSQHSRGQEAFQLFEQMQEEDTKPNQVTFTCLLEACSSIAAFNQGKFLHADIVERGFESDVFVGSTLINMYAKFGSLDDAHRVFDRSANRNLVIWNAMLAMFALHGDYKLALLHFECMQQEGLKPDGLTFGCLLSTCSRVGIVDEGCYQFKLMREGHDIAPSLEHYNSMVDLLGRAGHLDKAEDLLETMPFHPTIFGWLCLLNGCRAHGSVELGSRCFEQLVGIDKKNAAGYVIMSRIYAHAGMKRGAKHVEELRKRANAWKKPAECFIEVHLKVHRFIAGDTSHLQTAEIYAQLEKLRKEMKERGYLPRLDLVLQSMPDEDKEDALCGHCEKLAIAFGLICTSPGTTIRVTKNLRVCIDCHNAIETISEIEKREIVVIDAYRIHNFKDGACACKGYY